MTASPFSINPLELLKARALGDDSTPNAPGAGGNPPQPPSQPPAASAPAAVPPSPSGGSSVFGGIGTALSNVMSGAGITGASAGDQGPMDEVTGMTPGMERRSNMQSMMKMGIMLIAAGQRQSNDSRAKILSSMAGAIDTGDVNKFAHNRLEMAKLKLLEQKDLRERAALAEQSKVFGTGGGAAGTVPAGTPTATPNSAVPGAVAPTVTGPVENPSGAPGPGSTGTGDTGGAGGATGAVPAAVGAPAVAGGGPAATGAVPAAAGATGDGPGSTIYPDKPPPAPKPVPWTPTPEERVMFDRLPLDPTIRGQFIKERTLQHATQEVGTAPYVLKGTNTLVQDKYKNGTFVKTEKIQDLAPTTRVTAGKEGEEITETVVNGRVIDRKSTRNPLKDAATIEMQKDVGKNYNELRTEHDEKAAPAVGQYDKFVDLEDKVRSGGMNTGTFSGIKNTATNVMLSLGYKDPEGLQKLINGNAVRAEMGSAAGKFAKENFGPSVSDQDRKNAVELLGALETGQPEQIAEALGRIRKEEKRKIEAYNKKADDHNERVKLTGMNQDYYTRPRVEKDMDEEKLPWKQREKAEAAAKAEEAKKAPAKPEDKPSFKINQGDKRPMPEGFGLTPEQWEFMAPDKRDLFSPRIK